MSEIGSRRNGRTNMAGGSTNGTNKNEQTNRESTNSGKDRRARKPKKEQQTKKELQQQAKLRKARLKNAPTFIMMVGLPGSGKSTFAQRLEASSDGGWVRVCQDELGSRGTTEDACSRVVLGRGGSNNNNNNDNKKKKNAPSSARRCILDGCHVTPQLRKRWLTTAMNPKRSVAIYYTTAPEVCKRRAAARTDHPTGDLFAWGGGTIIDTKAKNLTPPTIEEGFEKVYQVSTMEDTNALLFALGGIPFEEETIQSWDAADISDGGAGGTKNEFHMCRQSDALNAEIAIQRLGLSEEDVDNIYVYGSRLWGTATEKSDFDLIIVCKPDMPKRGTHVGNTLDAMVMGRSEFQERLIKGEFLVTLSQYLPDAAIWRERWHPDTCATAASKKTHKRNLRSGRLNAAAVLSANVLDEFDRNLELAAKHYSKGAKLKAKKVLSHLVRMLILATQMADMIRRAAGDNTKKGIGEEPADALLDIDAANRHHQEIIRDDHHSSSWESILRSVEAPVARCLALLEEAKSNNTT
eukprot:CAMPEP_0117006202 /NCGR_PEP_ID=MMETSP0472-20121206/6520_1 /TAXON_ID=693140 ORGANISM="Tiarina fusus, Strain LIS" /NCGR_SAMPLE_ID=MMETSP0472 /ASSEMBLY_ACC=CAM_ASM_000603 /LENGTH=522 /DNA_ID=CAMNT_0004707611 /DNA_START=46 /DNA_END=1614 /DNA_ORIENTATION=+